MANFYPQDALNSRGRTLETVGLDSAPPPLRRGQDGRVDIDYYLERGRHERSKAAHRMVAAIGRALRALVARDVRSHMLPRNRSHHV